MANWYVTYNDGDILHYGKKGMKWGVRNTQRNVDASISRRIRSGQSNNKISARNVPGKSKSGYSGKYTDSTNQAILSGAVTKEDIEEMESAIYAYERGEIPELSADIMKKYYKYLKALPKDARTDRLTILSNSAPKAFKHIMKGEHHGTFNGQPLLYTNEYQKQKGQKNTKGYNYRY